MCAFVVEVLCAGERQTAVLLLGKEDGGQAREGAGQKVFFAAQRRRSPTERGKLELHRVFLTPRDIKVCASFPFILCFPTLQEKRKRREENLKRRAENERKAEIVQVVRQLLLFNESKFILLETAHTILNPQSKYGIKPTDPTLIILKRKSEIISLMISSSDLLYHKHTDKCASL